MSTDTYDAFGVSTERELRRGALIALRKRLRFTMRGSGPVLVGLVIVAVVFQSLNPYFLSANNLANLAMECAALGTVAIGVVVVLLVAEIDLSVGSIGGVAAAVMVVLAIKLHWPLWSAVLAGLVLGALIGLIYGIICSRFGVPSFVVTLAGLMALLGVQLMVMGNTGTLNIPYGSWLVNLGQQWFVPPIVGYVLAIAAVAVYAVGGVLRERRRKAAGLSTRALPRLVIINLGFLALCLGALAYLNTSRGLGVMVVLFIGLVVAVDYALLRTHWGRAVYAVGGSLEAARRAGIPVSRVRISAFVIGGTLAALGGLFAAARLAAAGVSSGGGDTNLIAIAAAVIGGTSLFGGRGRAWSALLGILVIQAIASGLNLLSLSSSIRFVVTGLVLVLAVIIDSVTRRSRQRHGQA